MKTPNKSWTERIDEAASIDDMMEIMKEFEVAIDSGTAGEAGTVTDILNRMNFRIKELGGIKKGF